MNLRPDIPAGTASGPSLGMGTFFCALVAPILAAGLLLGSNEADAAQAVVSGEFVAAIPNADPGLAADELVAVIVNDPSATGQRTIRAYICDPASGPAGDVEWFTGTITGDAFSLSSVDGDARIQGQLTETAATGMATLADGRVLTFRAGPATGGAGVFEIFAFPNGARLGVSASGAAFKGQVVDETVKGALTTRSVRSTVQPLAGPPISFSYQEVIVNDTGTDLQQTAIVLGDGRIAGRSSEIKQGTGTNYSIVIIDPD